MMVFNLDSKAKSKPVVFKPWWFMASFQRFSNTCGPLLKIQGVHKVSLQFKKLLQSEMMRYCNEGCFMLISIS